MHAQANLKFKKSIFCHEHKVVPSMKMAKTIANTDNLLQCLTACTTSIREDPCSGTGQGTKHTVMFITFLSFPWRLFKFHPQNTSQPFLH